MVAGAGSGKTRVLTRRIAWLITERRAHPGSILAITFRNAGPHFSEITRASCGENSGKWVFGSITP